MVAFHCTAGQAVFGRNQYIEYIPGNLPIIISAGHGGRLIPTDIPARTFGSMAFDENTQELARKIAAEFFRRTGKYPHLIINRLSRTRLDPNREDRRGGTTCELPYSVERVARLHQGSKK